MAKIQTKRWEQLKPVLEDLYYNQRLSQRQIGQRLGVCSSSVGYACRRCGVKIRPRSEVCGHPLTDETKHKLSEIAKQRCPHGPNWKGGIRHAGGYIEIRMPSHPRATKDGYVRQHILVWEQVHNKALPDGWVIHHLNGIKSDNRPNNLLAMPKQKHSSYIFLKAVQERLREKEVEVKLLRRALEDNQMIFYCEN